MLNLLYPAPQTNPEYRFDQLMSDYNFNFSAITTTLLTGSTDTIFTGGTVSGDIYFLYNLSAATFYSGSTPLQTIIASLLSGSTVSVGQNQIAFGSGLTGVVASSTGLTYSNDLFNLNGDVNELKFIITNTKTSGGYSEIKLATDISDTRFGAGGTDTTPYGGNAGDSYFGNVSNNGLSIATNNTVRGYFKNTGEVGIGSGFLNPKTVSPKWWKIPY